MKLKHHKGLSLKSWRKLSLAEQMANIGADVGRSINWKEKGNSEYARSAFERALELFDLSLASQKSFPALKEIARSREAYCDYFLGGNIYLSTRESFEKYFLFFNFLARKAKA
jgi:hypothetical protein